MKSVQRNRLFNLMLIILFIGLLTTFLNVYELHTMKYEHELHQHELKKLPEVEAMNIDQTEAISDKPIVWIQGGGNKVNEGRTSYLKHVYTVFERVGFRIGENSSDWMVMWSHDYPFVTHANIMKKLKLNQRVNHFPGSGYITNKVSLAQSDFEFIPKAFEMPFKKKEFLEYSERNKNFSWVQKSSSHRGIEVKDRHSLDLSKKGSFIQRFVSNPFLIDGHKFDIGIYTIITGIDPLRLYVIDGDALFRFCPEVYYPFDDSILDKYVVGDDYLPMWDLPSLKDTFHEKGFTFRDSFNEYLQRKKIDATAVWNKMKSAIRQVALTKEVNLMNSLKSYRSKRNFFEMVRFDFVLDDQLNVYLMEANMSPNLSSGHFEKNSVLYNHVIYNLLGLVGVNLYTSDFHRKNEEIYQDSILVSSRNIKVLPDFCETATCSHSCKKLQCKLCKNCMTQSLESDIKMAYLEHMQRGTSRRVFPPPIMHADALNWRPSSSLLQGLNEKNKLIYLWFIGKCRLDPGWCH